jgi:hypothetical protein
MDKEPQRGGDTAEAARTQQQVNKRHGPSIIIENKSAYLSEIQIKTCRVNKTNYKTKKGASGKKKHVSASSLGRR